MNAAGALELGRLLPSVAVPRTCVSSSVRGLSWATVAILAAQLRLRYGVELDETHALGFLANEIEVAEIDAIVARINRKRTLLRLQSGGLTDLTRVQLQVDLHRRCCTAGGGFRSLCDDASLRSGLGPFAVVEVTRSGGGVFCEPDAVAAFRVVGDRLRVVQAERQHGERVDVTDDSYVGHWLLDVKVVRGKRSRSDCQDAPSELLSFKERIAANLREHEGDRSVIIAQGKALTQQATQKRVARMLQEKTEAEEQHAAARRVSAANISRRLYLWRNLCGEACPWGVPLARHSHRHSSSGRHPRTQNGKHNHSRRGGSTLGFVQYHVPVNSPQLGDDSSGGGRWSSGISSEGGECPFRRDTTSPTNGPAPWSPSRPRRPLSPQSLI